MPAAPGRSLDGWRCACGLYTAHQVTLYLRTYSPEGVSSPAQAVPTGVVGGFEAAADATAANTVKLANCQWAGPADANGIAEMRILTLNRA